MNATAHGNEPHRWLVLFLSCAALWVLMRGLFFVGVAGSDDMYYMRYAALWDRAPANPWEARLLGNSLIASAMMALGRTEVAGIRTLIEGISVATKDDSERIARGSEVFGSRERDHLWLQV